MSDMKWTYVKDRLPEEDGDYIVAKRWSVTDRRDVATYGQRHTVWDFEISSFEYGEFSSELVYAWMPLPPLPDEMPEDAEPEEGANITPIEEKMPHKVSETMCWYCGHRWIDVRPVGVLLKQLQCPQCDRTGYAFETGEELFDDPE